MEGMPYLFLSTESDMPLSNMVLLQLKWSMSYGVKGELDNFCSSFRDWAGYTFSFPSNVAEKARAQHNSQQGRDLTTQASSLPKHRGTVLQGKCG